MFTYTGGIKMDKYIRNTENYTAEYEALITKVQYVLYDWDVVEFGELICEELIDVILDNKGDV